MYHSITFGDKNTFDDWHLVPKERPVFSPPTPKTNYVDIPGASSKLDFSEALTGYPTYENRTGTFDFYVLNGLDDIQNYDLDRLYSEIADYLHGKRMHAVLEDDPDYYYEGRYAIDSWKAGSSANEPRSVVTISYDVGPYKWYYKDSTDSEWLWDPFDFNNDYISSGLYGSIPITTTEKTIEFPKITIGSAPFTPTFIVTSTSGAGVQVKFSNPNLSFADADYRTLANGTRSVYDYIVYGSNCTLKAKVTSGTGTLSIKFRRGGL